MEFPTKARVSGIDYLAEERKNAQFDVQAMKVIWAGSERELQISQKMAALVASDPVFKKDDRPRKDRVELYKDSLKKAAHGWRRILDLKLSEEEAIKFRAFVDEPNYMDLHWGMFIPAMKGQATEEQQKYWLHRAYKLSIIGCYAQTELGHGSNVQGLETTATFDVATDEFVINSPTLTSSKWWPGGLGKASTHALVYARLITDNKDYGVHAFVVPIRSLEDHKPLPGITVGDIGVKFGNAGYNTMDNGLLRFNHIRIPRDYMLMRLAKVTRQGKYIASDVPKQIGYGAMVYVRQGIVYDSSVYLSRAVTIAVRYSCVRRQFGAHNGQPEVQVINYKTQQHRLFPLLATAYAYRFLGQWMKWLYSDVMARLAKSDFSTLPEVHACTAGLKSVTTSAASDAIEECRKLCGGHGYLCSSGLPELYAAYVPACTYEGDNIVLLLQVARFLMKTLNKLKSGDKPVGTASYLARIRDLLAQNSKVSKGEDWLTGKALLEAFEARSARMNFNCASKLAQAKDMEAGFEEFAVDLVDAARAHCELIVVSKFLERTQLEYSGRGISQQLQILSRVYALSLIESHAVDFLSTGYITPEQATLAKDKLCELYAQVRPNAVALVDAFDHTDHYLGSILGRYDGEVYPHLYNDAWNEPLNKAIVTEGYEAYLKPVLRQNVQGPSSRL